MTLVSVPSRRYLTRKEEAERLGISVRSLDRLVDEGLPREKWTARLVRFRPERTDRWLARRSSHER